MQNALSPAPPAPVPLTRHPTVRWWCGGGSDSDSGEAHRQAAPTALVLPLRATCTLIHNRGVHTLQRGEPGRAADARERGVAAMCDVAAGPPPPPQQQQQEQCALPPWPLGDAVTEQIFVAACEGVGEGWGGGGAPPVRASSGGRCFHPAPALPRVCHQWARVYTHSTLLWEEVTVDWALVAGGPVGRWVLLQQQQQQGVQPQLINPPPPHRLLVSPLPLPSAEQRVARWLVVRAASMQRLTLAGCLHLGAAALQALLGELM